VDDFIRTWAGVTTSGGHTGIGCIEWNSKRATEAS